MRLIMVGITGLEPMTSSSLTKRATKLRHIPDSSINITLYRNVCKNEIFG
jgi:hypothetical protein